jgi:L-ascorbate metabolism protein UlaG (beta-lactamase superfamily)
VNGARKEAEMKRAIIALCLILSGAVCLVGCKDAKRGAAQKDPGAASAPLSLRKYPGNYTAFKASLPGGAVVIFDPYALDEDVKADFVSISHAHEDHMDVSRIEPLPGAQAVMKTDVVTGKGARLSGFEGVHNKGDESVTNVMRLVEMGGYRILHLGSQAEPLGQADLSAIGKVDILIIQIFKPGSGKLVVAEAADIAKAVGARFIVPAHGDGSQTELLVAALGARTMSYPDGRALIDRALLDSAGAPIVADMDN